MKNKARIVYRTAYSLILLFSFSIFLYFVIVSVNRLLRYDTSISLDVKNTAETEFPAFTICPQYEEAYKRDILAEYGSDPDKIRKLIFPNNVDIPAKDFFELITFSADEIIESMRIKVGVEEKDNPDSNDVLIFANSSLWTSQTYILFGRCYTYAIPDEFIKLKVTYQS